MSRPSSIGDRKKYSVVQFIARPFKEIDDYVCVPDNWVVIRRHQDRKIVVSYPRDEEKSVTRERVKREEEFDDDWKFWDAEHKYQTDTFEDAELWITTGKNYVPLSPQHLSDNGTQSMPLNSTEDESSGTSTIDPKTIDEGSTETTDRSNGTVKLAKNEYGTLSGGMIRIIVLMLAYCVGWLSSGFYRDIWKGEIIGWN